MRFLPLAFLLLPTLAFAQTTLPGPGPSSGTPSVVALATVGAASLTGTTSITNIAVVAVPANLGKNGGVELKCLWTIPNNANNKILAVFWSNTSGATTGFQLGTNITATTSATLRTFHDGKNQNATNVQKTYAVTPITPFGASGSAVVSGAVNTALPSFLNITGTLGVGTDTITVEGCQGVATISNP